MTVDCTIERPLWFGRMLRFATGALLLWYGIAELQRSEWLLPGILIAVAIPLALTLVLFIFGALAGPARVLSSSQFFWWHRVYFIGVLVGLGVWRGGGTAFGTFVVFLGLAMLIAGVFRYGGCEVASIPNLILHRNYNMFCPFFSPIDRLERRFNTWLLHR